jgi:T5SS/PEP-CTERM-associated repeat protein
MPERTAQCWSSGAGSQWNNTANLEVGSGGTGSLTIKDGGTVTNVFGTIGYDDASNGTVTIDGTGALWINSYDLRVGREGKGTLIIQNGGRVNALGVIAGQAASGVGSIRLADAGSKLSASEPLIIGKLGHGSGMESGGSLLMDDPSVVEAPSVIFAEQAGSTGFAFIVGNGVGMSPKITIAGDAVIGSKGSADVSLLAGSTATSATLAMGELAGGDGSLTLSGAGTRWSVANVLIVGESGKGELSLSGEAKLEAPSTTFGRDAESTFKVSIGDANTNLITSEVEVGSFGKGNLILENSASVTWPNTLVASGAGSEVTVDIKSLATLNAHNFSLGAAGTADLTVSNGTLNTAFSILANEANATATATLTSAGKWINSDEIIIGGSGTGTIIVHEGTLKTDSLTVAQQAGSNGRLSVTMTATPVEVTTMLTVGDAGSGQLLMTDGGKLNTFEAVFGVQSGSTFNVAISDSAKLTISDNPFVVGNSGMGIVQLDFGSMAAPTTTLGYLAGSRATVVINPGSQFDAGPLTVGSGGTGKLEVNDGFLNTGFTILGDAASGSGTVTVSLAEVIGESNWTSTGEIIVGGSGTGTINVQGGSLMAPKMAIAQRRRFGWHIEDYRRHDQTR